MKTNITPVDLWILLYEHDWNFRYSDDHNEFRRGRDQYDEILRAVHESEECRNLFDVWGTMRGFNYVEGPPLSHKGLEVTRIGRLWVISTPEREIGVADSPRAAIAFIDAHYPKTRQLPDNILPFTARYQK